VKIKVTDLLLFTIVFVFLGTADVVAQDPTFTQFYANPVYLNPALAGSHGCPRLEIGRAHV
jgi:hypothetical protein